MEKNRIDPQWVEKARNGDQDAITALYTASYQTVYITIKSMLRADEADVLDILQESYIKAFQNLTHLEKTESFLPWMTSIARHATLDHLKKSKLLLFTELANDEGENYFEVADEDIGNLPEDALDQQETARLLQQIVDSLPTGERVAVAMFGDEHQADRCRVGT